MPSRLRERRQRRRTRRLSNGLGTGSPIPRSARARLQRNKLSLRRQSRRDADESMSPAPSSSNGAAIAPLTTLPAQALSQLTGISPTMERNLHALGHRRFFQVAFWTAQDVSLVADALRVPEGQIHDQRWAAQAWQRA